MSTFAMPLQRRTALGRFGWALRDGWTITRRELGHVRRAPTELLGAVIFPGLMVLMFGYIFGSAIHVPGGNYREYLMPGLFAMTSVMGVMACALLIAKDVENGVMDRFRSLPMARSAIPFGRAFADLVVSIPGLAGMVAIGLLVGWRAHDGLARTLAAFGLLLLLRFAISWIGVFLGLLVSAKAADNLVPLVFPITMLSNGFVPTSGMPGWLRMICDWNPVSALVGACRDLFGDPTAALAHPAWPLAHPVVATLGWSLILLAVFVPLATWRYHRAGR